MIFFLLLLLKSLSAEGLSESLSVVRLSQRHLDTGQFLLVSFLIFNLLDSISLV
jgi:hypothetical protein